MLSGDVLYEMIYTDLLSVYNKACRRKRHSVEMQTFDADYLYELSKLARALVGLYYKPQPGYRFVVFEPVAREIFASHFRDRVMHHLYFEYVSEMFEGKFIYNSFACRKKKGTLFGVDRLRRDIWRCSVQGRKQVYVLKCDLSGYFMHIDRQRLCDIVLDGIRSFHYKGKAARYCYRRPIAYFLTRVFALRDPIIGSEKRGNWRDWDAVPARKKMEASPEGCGLPIGDLTSQLFSNIYMNEFDQYVKHVEHCKYYGRYVDDFYVVGESYGALEALLGRMSAWLRDTLGVELSPKKCHIYKVSDKGEGVHFLGARIWLHHAFLSKRALRGLRLEDTPEGLNSYIGLLRHFSSAKMRSQLPLPAGLEPIRSKKVSVFRKRCRHDALEKWSSAVPTEDDFATLLDAF